MGSDAREHREFYLNPVYYDIAFDVRETARECDFLRGCLEKRGGGKLRAALELAAGPGYHALEYARRGVLSLALDIEPAMVAYLREKGRGTGLQVIEGDMRRFTIEAPVDLAYTLFGSFCYLLTNEDVRAHFSAVHEALSPGGVYVVELPHPRRFLRGDPTTVDVWTMERDGISVTTRWDVDHAVPDPLTHWMDVKSEYEVVENGRRTRIRSRGRQRIFFAQEILALSDGLFKAIDWYGAMDKKVPFDYARKAWRMVPVLQKIG